MKLSKLFATGIIVVFLGTFFVLFDQKEYKAANVNFSVNWSAGFESFGWTTTDNCTGLGASCSNGRVNDTAISTNVLFVQGSVLAVGDTHAGYWQRQLTWQSMGVPSGATVKSVSASIDARLIGDTSGNDRIGLRMLDTATTTNIIVSSQNVIPSTDVALNWNTYSGSSVNVQTAYQDYNTTVTLRIDQEITYGLLLSNAESRLHDLSIDIEYDLPSLEQSNYRFFANANSGDVGAPLAAQNSSATLAALDSAFRLRMNAIVSAGKLFGSYENYKLQYVDKGSGTCAAPSGGTPAAYTDVTASTLIAFNDNAGVADDAVLTANANDPTNSPNSVTAQSYQEANNFTNSVAAVNVSNAAMWDFSLKANGADPGKTFCLRIVKSGGSALGGYSQYPEINSMLPFADIDIVDGSGVSVADPQYAFAGLDQTAVCRNTTSTFSTTTQKIKVTNMTLTPGWTLSLAPTDGEDALWTNGTDFYDTNDPTPNCADGPDDDIYGGNMSINHSSASLVPLGGCTSGGLSLSSGTYNEGVNDNIAILSASGSADTICEWTATGFVLTQSIPGGQAPGIYTLDMTLTLVSN